MRRRFQTERTRNEKALTQCLRNMKEANDDGIKYNETRAERRDAVTQEMLLQS